MARARLPGVYGCLQRAAYAHGVAAYRWARIPCSPEGTVAHDFGLPPDVAMEVVSPERSVSALVRCCLWYVAEGVAIALLIDPADVTILLFRSPAAPRVIRGTDRIDVDPVLPGFRLAADELFQTLKLAERIEEEVQDRTSMTESSPS